MPSRCRVASSNSHGRSFERLFISHDRRNSVELINVALDHQPLYQAVGLVNRRRRIIESVFLMHPASASYAKAIAYDHCIKQHVWRPGPAGLMIQNRRLSVILGITAHEAQLHDPRHTRDLESLVDRMENLRTVLGAEQKTFAGVLPGLLAQRGIITDTPEADITATVVVKAIATLKHNAHLSPATPVIVLGGAGYVGRRVVAGLPAQHRVEVVDSVHGLPSTLPIDLRGKPAILLNVAAPGAIGDHMADL